MLLKRLKINNYRQFSSADINFDNELTILAGANNSGKTSIIELFKIVFRDKNFSIDDIHAEYYSKIKAEFIRSVEKLLKESKSETEFRENAKQFFSDKSKFNSVAIQINIEIQYQKDENISLFSDYLMELDENCTSFYFSYNYEINFTELVKVLSLESSNLFKKQHTTQKSKSVANKDKLDEQKVEYEAFLLDIFSSAYINTVYFTDRDYKNNVQIGIKEFHDLFKFNYLKATRLLNDEKTDHHFSISKELLNHFKLSEDWNEFKTQIIKDIKDGLKARNLNEKVKKHSLVKAQKSLDNIEKYFDYNKGEFSLQTDISDELLMEFLSSSLHTFFEYQDGTKLKEFSQGLGVSNLIYMCLKVEAFVKQYKANVVNIFVIEEPEAHMHPQMERMLIKFINDILLSENKNRVQGIVTTHSNEIIKSSQLKNIRVLRINSMLTSSVYDMNIFQQGLDSNEERHFYSFLFSINYSDLVFANKIIMYEGDTEKLYIEKLLTDTMFEELSNQYISFVQVGGAYSHWYRKLIHYLGIKTLIITDIDYDKKLVEIDKIKKDTKITNAGLIQFYKDSMTLDMLNTSIFPYCNKKCRKHLENCLFSKSELEQVSTIQADFRRKPCPKVGKPDYKCIKNKPSVRDIDLWMSKEEHKLIKVVSQGNKDFYTRTLEEAMLCTLLNISVESKNSITWWKNQIDNNKLKLIVPTKKDITVRDILKGNKNNKTDFMYSVILAEIHMNTLPDYIREGLIWLK